MSDDPHMAAKRLRSIYLGFVLVLLLAVIHVSLHIVDSQRDFSALRATTHPVARPEHYYQDDDDDNDNESFKDELATGKVTEHDDSKPYFVLHIGPPKVSSCPLISSAGLR